MTESWQAEADPASDPGVLFRMTVRDRAAVAGLGWLLVAIVGGGVTVLREDTLQGYATLLGLSGLFLYIAALLPVLAVEGYLLTVPSARRRARRRRLLAAALLLVFPLLSILLVSAGDTWAALEVVAVIALVGPSAALLGGLLVRLVGRLTVGLRQLLAGPVLIGWLLSLVLL